MSPKEIAATLASRLRGRRLAENLTQAGLAARAGVSLGSLKRFESTGQISLVNLLKVAMALDALEGIDGLFKAAAYRTLDDVMAEGGPADAGRKRGSRS